LPLLTLARHYLIAQNKRTFLMSDLEDTDTEANFNNYDGRHEGNDDCNSNSSYDDDSEADPEQILQDGKAWAKKSLKTNEIEF
jgi:hypothetical protein